MDREEANKVRQALTRQIESMDIPESQKQETITKISQMPPDELEKYLGPKCIFCNIALGQMKSFKIAENSEAVIVLEINPMSQGHSLLIPKKHVLIQDYSLEIYDLLRQALNNLKEKLNPLEINISSSQMEGHTIINLLPLSGKESGKREKAKPEDLEKLQETLKFEAKSLEKTEKKIEKIEIPKKEEEVVEKEKHGKIKVIGEPSQPEIIIEKAPTRIP